MAFFQSLRWPQSAPPRRRLNLPATCMVLTRMAVFWKSCFTACLISCLVALGATLRTYWLCFSARAVPFSVTRTDLTIRSGSRIGLVVGRAHLAGENEIDGVEMVKVIRADNLPTVASMRGQAVGDLRDGTIGVKTDNLVFDG